MSPFLPFLLMVSVCSANIFTQGSGNQQDTCVPIKPGLFKLRTDGKSISVCMKQQRDASTLLQDLQDAADLRQKLIAHWKMDEDTGSDVLDSSGNEQHAKASQNVLPSRGKVTRGRLFNAGNGHISVPNSPTINVGESSFSFAGWVKITDMTHPMTNFAVRKGYGCSHKSGWVPGWETAAGYYHRSSTRACIRDHYNNKVDVFIRHDLGMQPADLVGKWAHYTFVFDRQEKKIKLFINGKRQADEADMSAIKGSVDNSQPLSLGLMYGWNTKGTMDEYRFYKKALTDNDVKLIHADHRV